MNNGQRAKIFAPYAALTGFGDFISGAEGQNVPRVLLGEDAQAALDRQLRALCPGKRICVTYYLNGQYVEARGVLKRIDLDARRLLTGGLKIPLDDILSIEESEGTL